MFRPEEIAWQPLILKTGSAHVVDLKDVGGWKCRLFNEVLRLIK